MFQVAGSGGGEAAWRVGVGVGHLQDEGEEGPVAVEPCREEELPHTRHAGHVTIFFFFITLKPRVE